MEKECKKLKELAKPLQKWITSCFNPMCSIVIDSDRVIVVSRELSMPLEIEEN